MADNYCQGSYKLNFRTPENPEWRQWWKDVLEYTFNQDPSEIPEEVKARHPEALERLQKAVEKEDYEIFNPAEVGFDDSEPSKFYGVELEKEGVWLHGDESWDVNVAVDLIQAFLHRFNLDWVEELSYADTCSKPRIGEFGGTTLFITKDRIMSNTSRSCLTQLELDAQHGPGRIKRLDEPGEHYEVNILDEDRKATPVVIRQVCLQRTVYTTVREITLSPDGSISIRMVEVSK